MDKTWFVNFEKLEPKNYSFGSQKFHFSNQKQNFPAPRFSEPRITIFWLHK